MIKLGHFCMQRVSKDHCYFPDRVRRGKKSILDFQSREQRLNMCDSYAYDIDGVEVMSVEINFVSSKKVYKLNYTKYYVMGQHSDKTNLTHYIV